MALCVPWVQGQTNTTVNDLAGLQNALQGNADTIYVSQTIQLSNGTTIDGNGKVISVPHPYMDAIGIVATTQSDYCALEVLDGATVTIKDVTILGGGGGYAQAGALEVLGFANVTMENVTIARSYRGIYIGNSVVVMKNCNVVRNVCEYGGGIQLEWGGKLIMDGCSLSENRSLESSGGGGAMEISGTLYANNTIIANNSSSEIGGAINLAGGDAYLINCTVSGNTNKTSYGASAGAGIGNNGGHLYAANCIFMDNTFFDPYTEEPTPSDIGCFYSDGSGIHLINCIYGAVVYGNPNGTPAEEIGCRTPSASDPVFAGYRYDGVFRLTDQQTPGFKHGVLTHKGTDMFALYAPAGSYSQTGSVATFFDYSDLNDIQMGYDSESGMTSLGGLNTNRLTYGDGGSQVTTYYEPPIAGVTTGVRSMTANVIGASDYDPRPFYTIKLIANERVSVTGVTVYGESYPGGSIVPITHTPDDGLFFHGWNMRMGRSPQFVRETSNPYNVVMQSDVDVYPEVAQSGYYSLVVDLANKDYVSIAGQPVSTDGYAANSQVSVTANKPGYGFSHWVDFAGNFLSNANPYTITMDADKDIVPVFYSLSPLCFTAEAANSTIELTKSGSPTGVTIQYQVNGTAADGWTSVDFSTATTTGQIALANVGDKVYFRNASNAVTGFSTGLNTNYYQFLMTGSIAASGNVMSLVDKSCQTLTIPCNTCFTKLFQGCTSLTTAPALPATTLTTSCYNNMFKGCTSLTTAPALPATTLADNCYQYMFFNCSSLTTAPALPATTLTTYCYNNMFNGCTSLATAPALPATTLATYCYSNMFALCASLTTAPALPATTLAANCYQNMFALCASLTTAPALPATTLTDNCYQNMFQACSSLTTAPALPATTLTNNCYNSMFKGCSSLVVNETAPGVEWSIPAGATVGTNSTNNMFQNTGGDFTGSPVPGTTYYIAIPRPLCFTAEAANSTIKLEKTNSPTAVTIQYQVNGTAADGWTSVDFSTATTTGQIALANVGDKVYFRNASNEVTGFSTNATNYYQFVMTGSIAASGNVMSLVDKSCQTLTIPGDYCFYKLFYGCDALTTAPALPATTLANNCYQNMFHACSTLTTPPVLPATTLAAKCYASMFFSCTALTTAPALPADTLASFCYQAMFISCTSLTNPPALPAETLANNCYNAMFQSCSTLTTPPALPATTLANNCYNAMFQYCTSLTTLPVLPATTLADNCYRIMFKGCSSLVVDTTAPGVEWSIPAGATVGTDATSNMFSGTSGDFTGAPVPGTTYYIASAPTPPATVTANVNDTAMGSVTGAGTYDVGSQATLTATANEGYRFTNWTNAGGSTVSMSNPWTLTIAGDTAVTANFAPLRVEVQEEVDVPAITYDYALGYTGASSTFDFSMVYDAIGCSANDAIVYGYNPITEEYILGAMSTYDGFFSAAGVPTALSNTTPFCIKFYNDGTFWYCTHPDVAEYGAHYTCSWILVNPTTGDAVQYNFSMNDITRTATITANVNNTEMGSASGSGTYNIGSTATLTATPAAHYHFVNWSNGSTANPLTFTVENDASLTANFAIDQHAVTTFVNNATMGEVTAGGTYDYGSQITLTATPAAHYHFVAWSNGATDNPFVFTLVQDTNLTAIFEIDTHTVVLAANDATFGTVNGAGTYNYGTQVTLTATPAAHYHFVAWSNGATDNPFVFTLVQDTNLTAIFEIDTHTITGAPNNNALGFVTGSATVAYGTPVTLQATPTIDNLFVAWSNGETAPAITIIADQDSMLTAYFVPRVVVTPVTINPETGDTTSFFQVSADGYCQDEYGYISFTLAAGLADQYLIEFADEAFADIDWTDLPADNDISILIPADAVEGVKNARVKFRTAVDLPTGETAYAESDYFDFVFVVNLPKDYIRVVFDDVLAVDNSAGVYGSYQWYRNGDPVPGATKGYYQEVGGLNGDSYYVCVNPGTDSMARTCIFTAPVSTVAAPTLTVYPNPVSSTATVVLRGFDNGSHTFRVFNEYGVELMSRTFSGSEVKADFGSLPRGNYMVSVDGVTAKAIKH